MQLIHFAKRCTLSVLLVVSPVTIAAETAIFDEHEMQLPIAVSHPVVSADLLPIPGMELLVIGVNEQDEPSLVILGMDSLTKRYQVQDVMLIPPQFFAFDVGDTDTSTQQRLYFLSKNQLWQYQPAQADVSSAIKPLQTISSMYLADQADYIQLRDFAKDINHDGHDDFIIGEFEHLNLWLSQCCGPLIQQQLPIAARMRVRSDSVSYGDIKLFFSDMNNDALKDIVVVTEGQLNIFSQNQQGQFATTSTAIAVNPSIFGINWWDKVEADGQNADQSNLRHRVVEDIRDFNGDSIADMMVRFTQSSGVLDKTNDYELYLGAVENQTLQFKTQASTRIHSDETLSGLQIVDIEDDGRFEVMLSAFDLGLSQIISALIAGSIDQEMQLYALDNNDNFNAKPITTQDVEITFSLSRGRSGEPMVKLADINADGHKDIVLSDGDDKIKVIFATPNTNRPFARKSSKISVSLPSNAKDITDTDLNLDGKTDLIVHYGRLDAAENLNRIKILIAN